MAVRLEAEAEGPLTPHDDINVVWLIVWAVFLLDNIEGPETSEIVRREDFNLFTSFLGGDVFNGQRMDPKRLAKSSNLFFFAV